MGTRSWAASRSIAFVLFQLRSYCNDKTFETNKTPFQTKLTWTRCVKHMKEKKSKTFGVAGGRSSGQRSP